MIAETLPDDVRFGASAWEATDGLAGELAHGKPAPDADASLQQAINAGWRARSRPENSDRVGDIEDALWPYCGELAQRALKIGVHQLTGMTENRS